MSQTDRQTDRQSYRDTETDSQTDRHIEDNIETDRHEKEDKDGRKGWQTTGQTDAGKKTKTKRQEDRQTNVHTGI